MTEVARPDISSISYLYDIFDTGRFSAIIEKAVESIKLFDSQNPFDAIAFAGMSGAAIAYPLSYILKKHLICVRKPDIHSHSWQSVEGVKNSKRYIIVDDCIDSGETVANIRRSITEFSKTQLVGIYLHHEIEYLTAYWKTRIENMGIPIIQMSF